MRPDNPSGASRSATVTIDAEHVSPSEALGAFAPAAPLLVVTDCAFGALLDELGSMEAAVRRVMRVATDAGRPVGVNMPTGPGTSTTVFISPRGWADERTQGWVAAHHEALAARLGAIARVGRGGGG